MEQLWIANNGLVLSEKMIEQERKLLGLDRDDENKEPKTKPTKKS